MFGSNAHRIIAAGGALLALALPAAARADSPCDGATPPATWPAFAAFGDDAEYGLAPGGDFETGASGWSLWNASVSPGNEDLGVLGGDDSLTIGDSGLLGGLLGSLLAGSTSQAVSPPFCVTAEHPTFRFLFRSTGIAGQLSTYVRYRDEAGQLQEEEVHSRSVTTLLPGQWQPSDLQPLATALPLDEIGGGAVVQLVFRTTLDIAGGFQIDNVLVDPYRTR